MSFVGIQVKKDDPEFRRQKQPEGGLDVRDLENLIGEMKLGKC